MPGNLNDILPEPASEENEQFLLNHMKCKMKGAAGLVVRLLNTVEERFGPGARQVVRDMVGGSAPSTRKDVGDTEGRNHYMKN